MHAKGSQGKSTEKSMHIHHCHGWAAHTVPMLDLESIVSKAHGKESSVRVLLSGDIRESLTIQTDHVFKKRLTNEKGFFLCVLYIYFQRAMKNSNFTHLKFLNNEKKKSLQSKGYKNK